jgi:hypothetical protein
MQVTPELRHWMTQVYLISLRGVKLLVMPGMIEIQDDCSCIVNDEVVDDRFLERVQLDEDLLVLSYKPGRIWFITKSLRVFYNEVEETLRKAKLLGLD